MKGSCSAHFEETRVCNDCNKDIRYGLSLLKENSLLDKKVLELRRKEEYLKKRLKGIYGSIMSIQSKTWVNNSDFASVFVENSSLFEFFCKMQAPSSLFSIITNKEIAVSYVLRTGIYVPNMTCTCEKKLNLTQDPRNKDYHFMCENGHIFSFFERSIWEDFDLSPEKLVYFLLLWILGCRRIDLKAMTNISMYKFAGLEARVARIISMHFEANLPQFRGIVEVDESCFKHATTQHAKSKPEKWVFGLYERERKLNYMEVVSKRTSSYLIPIIRKRCEEGTTIISDQWPAYNKLAELGFPHYTVDHSRFFVNPHSREIHTQHIELSWCWAKYEIKRQNRILSHLQDSLNVFCWKRMFKQKNLLEDGDILESMWNIFKEYQMKLLN